MVAGGEVAGREVKGGRVAAGYHLIWKGWMEARIKMSKLPPILSHRWGHHRHVSLVPLSPGPRGSSPPPSQVQVAGRQGGVAGVKCPCQLGWWW